MGSYRDNRIAKRVPYPVEAECFGDGVSPVTIRIGDLSASGAFIDTLIALPPGTVLNLRFALPDAEVSVRAEVRYAMPQIGMGVRFLDLQPEHHAAINNFVHKGTA